MDDEFRGLYRAFASEPSNVSAATKLLVAVERTSHIEDISLDILDQTLKVIDPGFFETDKAITYDELRSYCENGQHDINRYLSQSLQPIYFETISDLRRVIDAHGPIIRAITLRGADWEAAPEGSEYYRGDQNYSLSDRTHLDRIRDEIEEIEEIEDLVELLPNIEKLHIGSYHNISNTGLASLQGLPRMKHLSLSYPTKNEDLDFLSGMIALTSLKLPDQIALNQDGIGHISTLSKLESLNIWGAFRRPVENVSDIPPEVFAPLGKLKKLRNLDLSENGILTSSQLSFLRELNGLESLKLSREGGPINAGVRDDNNQTVLFDIISGLKHLKYLELKSAGVRNEDLEKIGTLPELENLYLGQNPTFTSTGLLALRGCPKLSSLNLSGCRRIANDPYEEDPEPDLIEILGQLKSLRDLALTGVSLRNTHNLKILNNIKSLVLSDVKSPILTEILRGIPQLEILGVGGGYLSERALNELCKHKNLISLSLHGSYANDEFLGNLGQLPRLRRLSVYGLSSLRRNAFEKLSRNSTLHSLSLAGCTVIEEGCIILLTRIPTLRDLDLEWTTGIDATEIERLTSERPDINITGV
jgi:hypothetical protein